MKPDRTNYQIWLIDWLDGNLDDFHCNELMKFLEANPDLKDESDFLAASHISPDSTYFPMKEKLLRSSSDLPLSQVEYLSIACLEKDISPEEMSDLELNINRNPENKRIFELYQKIRLSPPEITFKNKTRLKRYTIQQKLLRYSIVSMSAAAAFALFILSYILIPRFPSESENQAAEIINADSTLPEPFVLRTITFKVSPDKQVKLTAQDFTPDRAPADTASKGFSAISAVHYGEEASVIPSKSPVPPVSKIQFFVSSDIYEPYGNNILIASNNTYPQPATDDGRSRFSKFIARTFREKLLQENPGNEAPLKTYEIAEAGIDGLNKLLGWEMAFVKTTDETGELKSIYFSSKVLKFNAPVKKTEMSE